MQQRIEFTLTQEIVQNGDNKMMKDSLLPGPSSAPNSKVWKAIWKAPVNPRIRNFLWRLAKNILPTKDNLSRRGTILDTMCPFCAAAPETAQHLFCQCTFAQQTFFSSILSFRTESRLDVRDWLFSMLSCGDVFSTQLLATLLYRIWLARNLLIFKNQLADPVTVAQEALNCVSDDNKSLLVSPSNNLSMQEEYSPKNVHILNVDAGVFSPNSIAFGCVLKAPDGGVILSACRKEALNTDPLTVEMLAIRWSIRLALDLKIERLVVQSDCLNVVDCVNSVAVFATIEPVAEDVRCLLSHFLFASLMYVGRKFNTEAHSLVGAGNILGSKTWIGAIPSQNSIVTAVASA
ncbi:uncharacterized protein LOC131615095 [Vicia villosa]|uniref:uncharacterized protein LOC131615095 n=1 Tax=Vicia villosa TaxID=3911 RepID=UPI00273CA28B|nr:uncharacterized protein LOC131615095 [Vicia villosa]